VSVAHERIEVRTRATSDTVDVTPRAKALVERAGIRDGICVVAVMHTTAGVFVNENADPDVRKDVLSALARAVPDDAPYAHAEGNGPAHVRSVLVGNSVTIPVRDGSLDLGTWQGIYLAEFDGPRVRSASITVIGDAGH
jgi:secondary thiamine-phosphate synthase enzyme